METDCSTSSYGELWKKPEDIMKLRKKKTSLNSTKRTLEKRSVVTLSPKPPKPNPFKTKSSEIKRLEKEKKSLQGDLLKKVGKEQRTPLCQIENMIFQDRIFSPKKGDIIGFDDFPTDWSLKVKARFTSPHSFEWSSTIKSLEEATGIMNFTRCCANLPHQHRAMFQQCLMQWVHPDTVLTATNLPESLLTSIRQQWSISFNSIYHLYQAGICPYFYVIAQNFVVLFLLKGFDGTQINTVYITPTTIGIRKALLSEACPWWKQNQAMKETLQVLSFAWLSNITDILNLAPWTDASHEDDTLWMESMGITRELTTIMSTMESSRLNHQPNSLVQIEGKQIHAFFNYFLNYQISHTVGMPATILSPIAFEGGVLRSLKHQQGKAKEYKSRKKYKETHYLEISGFMMPQQLTQLCRLMGQMQNGDYSVTLSAQMFTAAFNFSKRKCDLQESSDELSPVAGLSADDVKHFTLNSSLDKKSLRRLDCHNFKYTWEV